VATETGTNSFLSATSATARLYEEASRYLPGGTSRLHYYFRPYPIYARSGNGCRVTDVEGVERIDLLNNMTALIHGHRHPKVNEAILEQLELGTAFSEPAEPEVRLARLLVERIPSIEKIRFANSGTEAVMMSIKLARAFTGRSRIAKFEGFYHGYYDYVQVSYNSGPSNWGSEAEPASVAASGGLADSVVDDVLILPFNDRPAVERLLTEHGDSIAALLVDPMANRAGFPRPTEGFYDFLREITRQHGIVLIFDEVISFRVGHAGAQGKYGGDPDLTTYGKIIGGGLPVGAVGGRDEIMALLDPSHGPAKVVSGGTYSGNPLTMAAGVAAMELLTPEVYARLDELGERLRARANAVFADHGEAAQLTGNGSVFRILMTDKPIVDYRDSLESAAQSARLSQLHLNLLDEGFIVSNSGLGALSTPMSESEVDQFVAGLARAVENLPRRE
jgi:glutamate-1-semialdehyde 2,1-aminomutase